MELRNCKYGIFWVPPASLQSLIHLWKEQVRLVEPEAVYLDHPVHSTFFLLMTEQQNEEEMIVVLEKTAKAIDTFFVQFTGWFTFDNDAATGGGDTLVMGIETSEALFGLQQKIATALSVYKKENIHYPVSWRGDYLASYERWGFPFVGKHWVPHISIASVKAAGKKIAGAAKASHKIPAPVMLETISLYRVEKDAHIHLKTLQLTSNAN